MSKIYNIQYLQCLQKLAEKWEIFVITVVFSRVKTSILQ